MKREAFCTTHWSLVLTAARGDTSNSAHEALVQLCSIYWYPLYSFCRRQGQQPQDAEDSTQAFFARFLEKNGLGSVRPEHGRFRSFLLACLKNFLANERERLRAQRRGGGRVPIPLNSGDPESRYSVEPVDTLTPEAIFDRRWAFAVVEQTLEVLRSEYASPEKRGLFEMLQGFLPGGHENISRAELAEKRGVSVSAIDVAIHRMRQRFGAVLREQVARTVSPEAEVEAEIRYLISVISP